MPKLREGLKLKEYQKEGVYAIRDFDGRALVADEMGLGKAQPIDCEVLTPEGWRTIGSICEGDMVYGSNGKPTRVTGVFPQGKRKVFEVVFSDGVSTRCCDEHLWNVNTATRRWRGLSPRVLTLSEIRKTLKDTVGNYNHFVPVTEAVEMPPSELKIPPYLLGVLLGDGCIKKHVTFSSPDADIISRVENEVPRELSVRQSSKYDYSISRPGSGGRTNPITGALREYGLFGHGSDTKFIPPEYLIGSIEQRVDLLHGLMDTDGYTSKQGVVQFSSNSVKLADGVAELVRSLGGVARISWKISSSKKRHFMVTISMPNEFHPFWCKRKADRYSPRSKYRPARNIRKVIELAGEQECVCISVEAEDHLYLTDAHIVTHNTWTALTWIAKTKPRPCLVVCPASMKATWQMEGEHTYGLNFKVLHGQNRNDINIHGDFIIINYDIFQYWESAIKRWKPQTIILDEAHKVKHRSAKRSQSVKRVCRKARSVVALTGTPFENCPFEIWNILDIVNPSIFPNMMEFARRYCKPRFHAKAGWQFKGATKMDELFEILHDRVMIRRTKSEVLSELPDKIRTCIYMEPDKKGREEYEKAENDFFNWLGRQSVAKVKKAKKNSIVKIGYLLRLSSEIKEQQSIDWIREFLDDHPDRKLVAFSMHTRMIRRVMEEFPKAVMIDGSVKHEDRKEAVTRFQKDKKTRLFVGQVIAAGEGITLTAAYDTVFLDLPWNPAKVVQAEDRIHRISQTKTCTIYYHILKGSMEQKVAKMIYRKASAFSRAIDGEENVDAFEELIS